MRIEKLVIKQLIWSADYIHFLRLTEAATGGIL